MPRGIWCSYMFFSSFWIHIQSGTKKKKKRSSKFLCHFGSYIIFGGFPTSVDKEFHNLLFLHFSVSCVLHKCPLCGFVKAVNMEMEALFLKLYLWNLNWHFFKGSDESLQLWRLDPARVGSQQRDSLGGCRSPRCTQLKFIHISEGKADMNLSLKGIILS